MLDAKNMWMALAALALVATGYRYVSPPAEPPDNSNHAIVLHGYGDQMRVERITRQECVASGDRIWLAHKAGNDCVTVIVPSVLKGEGTSAETAIVFIDGDVPLVDQSATGDERTRTAYVKTTEALTTKFGVPVLVVARPGVLGSSGTHHYGGRRDDTNVIDAALDELKKRYSIRKLVMAGQSGGTRLIAQLMVLGRRDIACAVLGSGAYDTPNVSTNIFGDPGKRYLVPMRHASDVPEARERRVFVIGDPNDSVTPFAGQTAWAAALGQLKHHVVLIETEGRGDKHHGVARQTLDAAVACAKGQPDADVVAATSGKRVALP